jgi:uncharacterized protein
MTLDEIKEKALPVLRKHHIKKAGIFGSFAKGTFHKRSDVDMLVELPTGFDLLTFVNLKFELQKTFRKKVDIGEFKAIRPRLKEHISKETLFILND